MTESKIDATHRLHKSGQWHEASLFRDAERKRFREQGMTRAEAGDAAWAVLAPGFAAADGVSLVSSAAGKVLGALSAFAAFVASPSAAGGGSGTAFSEPLGRRMSSTTFCPARKCLTLDVAGTERVTVTLSEPVCVRTPPI